MPSFLRSAFRRIPPVARRDAAIARLRRQVSKLRRRHAALADGHDELTQTIRDDLAATPSYQAKVHTERRLRRLAVKLGAPSTSVIRHGKLQVYDLARSHGIDPPVEYGRWDDPLDIDWAVLPDRVVIKSAFSSTSRGVFPLHRVEGGWRVITGTESMTAEHVVATLSEAVAQGRARPPFIAEEFLDEDGTGALLPMDVKVYAFYGEVPMVVLRRPGQWGEPPSQTPFRVVDPHGQDLPDLVTQSTIDESLPVPGNLAEIVEAGTQLSVAIRAPFARIDFYSLGDRVVFGEVTPRPGGSAWHGPVVDRLLGEAWERAEIRLARDLADGLPPEPQFGPIGRS